jgi:hypothetical protein
MVLESPIHADLALIKSERGDRWGKLSYRMTARNFGPVMAMAARTTPWPASTRGANSVRSTPRPWWRRGCSRSAS